MRAAAGPSRPRAVGAASLYAFARFGPVRCPWPVLRERRLAGRTRSGPSTNGALWAWSRSTTAGNSPAQLNALTVLASSIFMA